MTRHLYVETSALLRVLLEGDGVLRPVLSGEGLFTSALTFVEAARAISRAERNARLSAKDAREAKRQLALFERACDIVALDDEVLRRVRENFPEEPVRSLDALHLASFHVLDVHLGEFEVASCDHRIRRDAAALGFAVLPVSDRTHRKSRLPCIARCIGDVMSKRGEQQPRGRFRSRVRRRAARAGPADPLDELPRPDSTTTAGACAR